MAARVAAELKKSLGIDANVVRGGGGVFQVRRDGVLIYDKAQTHRFPDDGEITRLLT